jgi:hypothetical protein
MFTEEFCLLGYNAVLSIESQAVFQKKSHLHLKGQRFVRGCLLTASCRFLSWLDLEDGGDMFLQNIN